MGNDKSEKRPHQIGAQRYEHLDMLRGLAALLVLIGHVRGFVFVDLSSITANKLLYAPFYLLTGLGHQAVMVFFALSGFLVGGSALRKIHEHRWNGRDYAFRRFSRLWTALIPALFATLLLDWIGRDLLQLHGYDGEFWNLLSSGPSTGKPADLSAVTFLGNVFFVQTLTVPVLGTNGPLWSLANEFWYYFLIPLGWLAIRGGVPLAWRIGAGLFAIAGCVLLPLQLVLLGTIWILGALEFQAIPWIKAQPRRTQNVMLLVTITLTLAGVAATIVLPGLASDLALGFAFAMMLPCLTAAPALGGLYGRIAFAVSEISFTLYVVHFPFIALLWFALFEPAQFLPGPAGLAIWAGLVAAAIAFATGMWWLFERNTDRLRKWVQRRITGR